MKNQNRAHYAQVIVDIALEKLDRTFTYRIPENLQESLRVGMAVEVPFGGGNRPIKGYVMELSDQTLYDPQKIKDIIRLLPQAVTVEQQFLQLADWMHRMYGATQIQCLKTVMPVRRTVNNRKQQFVQLRFKDEQLGEYERACQKKNARAKLRLLAALKKRPELTGEYVTKALKIPASTLQAMETEGVIVRTAQIIYRDSAEQQLAQKNESGKSVVLHPSQRQIVERVVDDYKRGQPQVYLLHGVTGSGKTEVYMEIAARLAALGRQSIVLIPEIALTYQTVLRFQRAFGERVAVLHSRMSQGERFDQFERAKAGGIDVMIGPRSALFTPFQKLGAIFIDEEHEGTYKSETMPRYHARETAIERARMCGACVVLGSATPSLESYTKAKQGEYVLCTLKERRGDAVLPAVELVDLRAELARGNRSMFSDCLKNAISSRLERREQTMLFLNRRGYAGFVSCRECGKALQCPHCDVSLSYHKDGRLHCHYCGYTTAMVSQCPSCGSKYIGTFRSGTQQVEEALARLYPNARILRMDTDTTRQKGSYAAILEQFAKGEADILVGTQMIVKGHDFPNVTLMGILAADLSLMASDYRAAERTFQLLAQAAGRAGRRERAGQVVIQTYQPEHYALKCAAAHDYEQFYNEEMGYRMLLGYPPAAHMLAVWIAAEKEEIADALAAQLGDWLRKWKKQETAGQFSYIGPAPAGIAKLRDLYQRTLYVKADQMEILTLLRQKLEQQIEHTPLFLEGSVQFDLDPMH